MEEVNYIYDTLIDMGLFTEGELELVTSLNGYSIDALNDCLYVRYGYRSLEQYLESEGLQ